MKAMMTAFAAISLAMGTVACSETATDDAVAESTIAGTWKANLDSAKWENDVSRYLLADGQYTCESCLPPYGFAADGQWQKVDRPGLDSQMMEVVDANTVRSASRLGDKDVGNATWTVSEDGQTMTVDWNDLAGAEPIQGQSVFTRTAAGPEGSHAVSGAWTISKLGNMSDAGLTFSFALDGDKYTSSGNGQTYTATLGGEPVAIEGDTTGTMVAVEKTGANGYRETYTRDGEVVSVTELTIDGNTLTGKGSDPRDGSSVSWTATRQ